ncbi:MAG: hypothetical protein P8P30_08730 [Rickettsiales bacterium]|nr:hypothetical protein [Rickettsiales bacterium]
MQVPSHVSRLHSTGNICLLSSSIPDSITMYFYVKLNPHKQKQLFADMDTLEWIKLTDYGEILESGIGKTPSNDSIVKMLHEHDFATPKLD